MAERVSLQFSTGSQENAERFIKEYVLDTLNRVPKMDDCDSFTLVPGHPAASDLSVGFQISCHQ